MITTRIQGIPCQVEMTDGHYQTPDHTTWASDWDYHGGWFDVKFEVYKNELLIYWREVTEASKYSIKIY